jgi:O-antigen ligase
LFAESAGIECNCGFARIAEFAALEPILNTRLMHMNSYRSTMDSLTQKVGVLMVFVLIFGTAVVNSILFILLVVYSLSGDYAGKWRRIRGNPAAITSLLLFGLFAVGMSYSSSNLSTALEVLNKYRELLLFPIAISIFHNETWRRRAYYAFLAAILVGMLVSFCMYFGWLPPGPPGQEWIPFKSRISYGFFMAYAIYLMGHHLLAAEAKSHRFFWVCVIGLAYFNLMFMASGRTGHIVLLALLLLLGYQYRIALIKRWMIVIPVLVAVVAVTILTSPAIQSRSDDIDVAFSRPAESSIGERLIMWQTTLRIIEDHPIFGAGTGSFEGEYAKKAYDHPSVLTGNPHDEYLLIAGQLGLIGLGGFLLLLYRQWKLANKQALPYSFAAQGLVLAMAVGCMFNSFLYDHGEGHFYAIFAGLLLSGLNTSQDRQVV